MEAGYVMSWVKLVILNGISVFLSLSFSLRCSQYQLSLFTCCSRSHSLPLFLLSPFPSFPSFFHIFLSYPHSLFLLHSSLSLSPSSIPSIHQFFRTFLPLSSGNILAIPSSLLPSLSLSLCQSLIRVVISGEPS